MLLFCVIHALDFVEPPPPAGSVTLRNCGIGLRESELCIDLTLGIESIKTGGESTEDAEVVSFKFSSVDHLNSWIPIFSAASQGALLSPPISPYPIQIELLEHQHTLFCERKQRVCTAVGKTQELEKARVVQVPPSQTVEWIRSSAGDKHSVFVLIEGSEVCSNLLLVQRYFIH
jgi:hypothetical protein